MSKVLLSVVRMLCWFWGLFPLCYYVALTVVCGLHQRWISFGFALATAALLAVWLILNGAAIISAWTLNHRRHTAAHPRTTTQLPHDDVAGTRRPHGAALHTPSPPAVRQCTATTKAAARPTNDEVDRLTGFNESRAFDDVASEVDLTSIQESTATVAHTNVDSVSYESTTAATGENPLVTKTEGMLGNRRVVVRAHGPTMAGDRACSEVEDTILLSPPASGRSPAGALPRATAPSPPHGSAPRAAQVVVQKRVGSDSLSAASDPHKTGVAEMGNDSPGGPARAPRVAGYTGPTSRASASSSKVACVAFMMPVVSIYVTIALTLLILVASIFFEYDTHCLMLAFPALSVPCLWSTLLPLVRLYDACPKAAQNCHMRVLRFMTCWSSLAVVWLVGLAVYVAAVALEVVTWIPYMPENKPTPRAIRVVSYLSPIPTFIIVTLFAMCAALQARKSAHRSSHQQGTCDYRWGATVLTDRAAVAPRVPSESNGGGGPQRGAYGGFTGTPNSPQMQSPTDPRGTEQGMMRLAAHSPTITRDGSEDTASTLSSIVRSSMSSIFIPPSGLTSPSALSHSKNHIRVSCTGSTNSGGAHNVPQAAHINSLPQLKTVTSLYLAYRNIYDDTNIIHELFNRSSMQGGMAVSRNIQQTIATNYEAMMEAIEDAREQGSGDANAYILTAYEDILCLVWGLMPFSSEPVLVAVEKARRIMEAFQSRPKPPPASPDEQQELVAAVVSAPHSLVGFLGRGNNRAIHFFDSRHHQGPAQLLQRGLAMFRRLPSMQGSTGGSEHPFRGILMNARARNNTASHILARPCGIKSLPPSSTTGAVAVTGGTRRPPMGIQPSAPVERYPIMYEFLDLVPAQEEEWHLVVQRQERLGAKFGFLTDATQLLQQGDTKGAREVLRRAVEDTDASHDPNNVALAQIMLEDLDRITSQPS
ncbi:hypothetical protein ABB37_07645 [Leptomonas pyrrhocoris]|uniref:Uncharacterized protein n=1 Tax=Leptomonas pyrrhocoris TaxID=157538 RepID=A0A0M9FVP7_LEPPY|nr:hypothetical protein ABB37_07645 [Leptomonas pyrrhocoris]KPA76846.1 hypothetical protein ABB37_07645 [Leptomonas pyrrhocoris]|eukprot:XP_015655285.1 hypothetical protein ABB37_07645 [Leptomonas pyrrhocoris]